MRKIFEFSDIFGKNGKVIEGQQIIDTLNISNKKKVKIYLIMMTDL